MYYARFTLFNCTCFLKIAYTSGIDEALKHMGNNFQLFTYGM